MNRVFESALVECLGDSVRRVIIHSYRDDGDEVLVNYEIMYKGRALIGRTSMVP